jgi:serine/threonine-protein kinase
MNTQKLAHALIGQTLGKKYTVRRVIGEGGMGAVYEVEHALTKRVGALKLLHRSYADVADVVVRFVREASAAGRIENPHIVETFDAGELESGEPYIFMELLSGHSLRDLIRTRGRFGFSEARALVAQATEGLTAAHDAGIVHRDIKPDNLFVCGGGDPFVKILDFGISKFAPHAENQGLTAEGTPMGTPYYMSPEQVVGQPDVDARTDVYALGVVLYECITGKLPFDAETLPALSIKIFEGHFESPSRLVPDAPEGLDALVARAMAVDPNDRYADMRAFRDALLELEAGDPRPLAFAAPRSRRRAARRLASTVAVGGLVVLSGLYAWLGTQTDDDTADPEPVSTPATSARREPERDERPAPSVAAPASVPPSPDRELSGEPRQKPMSAAKARRSAAASLATAASAATALPLATASSRAARDGLSVENPFDDPVRDVP